MGKNKLQGINFFERYLTVWVALCMVIVLLLENI
jgi:ACR3 family arsenite transporter